MFKILVKTEYFLSEFCKDEIKYFYLGKLKKLNNIEFELEFDDEKNLCKFLENVFYYSRTIRSVSLNGEDLIGFDLFERDYMINKIEETLNLPVSVFLFYKLGLHKIESFSVVDPSCGFGDLIIECSLFRQALNVRKRNDCFFSKKFRCSLSIPEKNKEKSKFFAIVQENSHFKKIKENITYSGSKIKVSQFSFDMLDVKFKENQFDFLICDVRNFSDDILKEFFYMAEFVSKCIGIVCERKINKKLYEGYNLDIVSFDKIIFEGKNYFVYVLK